MSDAPDLKPCPFCGSEDLKIVNSNRRGLAVSCNSCRFDAVGYWSDSTNSISAAWNTRADLAELKGQE